MARELPFDDHASKPSTGALDYYLESLQMWCENAPEQIFEKTGTDVTVIFYEDPDKPEYFCITGADAENEGHFAIEFHADRQTAKIIVDLQTILKNFSDEPIDPRVAFFSIRSMIMSSEPFKQACTDELTQLLLDSNKPGPEHN